MCMLIKIDMALSCIAYPSAQSVRDILKRDDIITPAVPTQQTHIALWVVVNVLAYHS